MVVPGAKMWKQHAVQHLRAVIGGPNVAAGAWVHARFPEEICGPACLPLCDYSCTNMLDRLLIVLRGVGHATGSSWQMGLTPVAAVRSIAWLPVFALFLSLHSSVECI